MGCKSLILVIVGIPLGLILLVFGYWDWQIDRNPVPATGRVTKVVKKHMDDESKTNDSYDIHFAFDVDGNKHEGNISLKPDESKSVRKQKKVSIIYAKGDPTLYRYAKRESTTKFSLGLGAFFFGFGLLGLISMSSSD